VTIFVFIHTKNAVRQGKLVTKKAFLSPRLTECVVRSVVGWQDSAQLLPQKQPQSTAFPTGAIASQTKLIKYSEV